MTENVKSAWDLLREAIQNGETKEALELLDRGLNRFVIQQDSLVSFVSMALTQLAGFGEEELLKFFKARYERKARDFMKAEVDAKTSVESFVENMIHPSSKISIKEEPDRFVVSLDPCRTGGRLRRSMADGSAKFDTSLVGTIKKAYPWTWGKKGLCVYCAHDCLYFEMIPIELRGYPIAVVEYPDNPKDPCVWFFYKKPELIPEKYFTRIGKTKTKK